jgi:hypothetical protein
MARYNTYLVEGPPSNRRLFLGAFEAETGSAAADKAVAQHKKMLTKLDSKMFAINVVPEIEDK